MRKTLLATSALALAGTLSLAAQPALAIDKATVGGRYLFQFGLFDYDAIGGSTDGNSREIRNDVEVHFDIRHTLDNGLRIDAQAEIQNGGNNSTNFDEAWIGFSGGFGQIVLGDNDGAVDRMSVYAPGVGDELDLDGDFYEFLDDEVEPLAQGADSEDASKIYYVTPKLGGFQFGASWAPEVGGGDEGTSVSFTDPSGNRYSDWVELAATFEAEFDGGDVEIGGTYTFADSNDAGRDDVDSWMIGAQVGFGGWKIGGAWIDEGGTGGIRIGEEQEEWNLGVTYENGPLGLGLNYASTEKRFSNGQGEQDLWLGMWSYEITKGLAIEGNLGSFSQNYDAIGIDDNDGYILTLQTRVNF